jgi:hypothetical protein
MSRFTGGKLDSDTLKYECLITPGFLLQHSFIPLPLELEQTLQTELAQSPVSYRATMQVLRALETHFMTWTPSQLPIRLDIMDKKIRNNRYTHDKCLVSLTQLVEAFGKNPAITPSDMQRWKEIRGLPQPVIRGLEFVVNAFNKICTESTNTKIKGLQSIVGEEGLVCVCRTAFQSKQCLGLEDTAAWVATFDRSKPLEEAHAACMLEALLRSEDREYRYPETLAHEKKHLKALYSSRLSHVICKACLLSQAMGYLAAGEEEKVLQVLLGREGEESITEVSAFRMCCACPFLRRSYGLAACQLYSCKYL